MPPPIFKMNSNLFSPSGCLVAGIIMLVLGVVLLRFLSAPSRWPKTTGVIVKSSVESGWPLIAGKYTHMATPEVIYEYHVGGKRYTSSQLALVEIDSNDDAAARRKAEKYSPGQQVDVYYNPQKPWAAVLTPGDSTGGTLPIAIIVIGASLLSGGAIWFWLSRK
ncbi:MAG TPA: DUF3592 domain-containing protein [Verrucomicrobiae bacterium]|jgi:hypothetical protein|nr:DUF3592 domain-containing protein [Verrucomicrobiae bacterium]